MLVCTTNIIVSIVFFIFFFFNDTATTEIYTLSLHDALPIFVRAGTSDKPAFEQVFVFEDYDTSFIRLRPELIIDAGANAGFATRFLAQRYPSARIVAIEPEASNFELLVRNTRHLDAVAPIRAALWNRSASLRIENPRDDKWAFRIQQGAAEGSAQV